MNTTRFEIGQSVEIAEHHGKRWVWSLPGQPPKTGLVTKIDKHCLEVRRDDTGIIERDVIEHYRPLSGERT